MQRYREVNTVNRAKKAEMAKDTYQKSLTLQKNRNSQYFSAERLEAMKKEPLQIEVQKPPIIEIRNEDVVETIRKEEHPIVLNFASAKNPGGGFLKGASAQEESICRASDLYLYLVDVDEFYKNPIHYQNTLYDSDLIFSTNVSLIKDATGTDIEEKPFDVITSCAVNVRALKQKGQHELLKQVNAEMKKRIDNVFEIAIRKQAETLILGAFGCGVFGNDPYEVRDLFIQAIKNPRYRGIKKIIFSIYKDEHLFNIFKTIQP